MLKVANLSFSYGRHRILRDVSFTVNDGETVGLIGKNGAGKTTLMKVLATCLAAGEGSIALDDADSLKTPLRYRRRIGYVAEKCPLYGDMTIKEYLKFRARLKGERSLRLGRRVLDVMKLCGLTDRSASTISTLSMGYHKRITLADALLRRPALLLIDDLFPGLDAEQRNNIRSILTSSSVHSAALISGHELKEMAEICTRFLVLREGRVVDDISIKGMNADDAVKLLEKAL